jgi:hypothetical protein
MRLIPLLLVLLSVPAVGEDIPSLASITTQTAHLIAAQHESKKPATLALLRDAVALALSYGVPTYNSGDHEGCMTCYRNTIAAVVAGFPDAGGTSTAAAMPLHDLADAATRAHGFIDVDRQAWALRFGFDQVNLACTLITAQGQMQVQSGSQYLARGDNEEAEVAFGRGTLSEAELHGSNLSDTPANVRIATVLHAQALLMLKQMPKAASEMAKGMVLVPELAPGKFDLHSLYMDQVLADKALENATAYASAHATDADALFLQAFEEEFSGKVDEAAKTLAAVLKLAPTHAAALLLTTPAAKTPAKAPSETVP